MRYMHMLKRLALRLGSVLLHDASPKVVFYHDIGRLYTGMGTPQELFWEHMRYLHRGDVVCFDDGFRGIWDEQENLNRMQNVIVFIAIDLVGKPGYLTWDEIRKLQNEYNISFQCHTWSHQTLAGPWNKEVPVPAEGRTEDWFRHELVDSKTELENRLGRPVTSLCFPVGYFNDDVVRRCRDAGYEKVYASYPGNVTDEYIQPRCLAQDLSVPDFKCVLNGGMRALKGHYLARHRVNSL